MRTTHARLVLFTLAIAACATGGGDGQFREEAVAQPHEVTVPLTIENGSYERVTAYAVVGSGTIHILGHIEPMAVRRMKLPIPSDAVGVRVRLIQRVTGERFESNVLHPTRTAQLHLLARPLLVSSLLTVR